ncbi:uncharacterized protein [Spinacia oleracea]|uniref:RNase H type-1 domain-containing protein n=1 Tax=Spinacia oleracea TaxID=3562 RepID=A0A9R0IKL1_SPIOL|nr:uncharacterized protein LOC110790591 [Spinacia oleracea]
MIRYLAKLKTVSAQLEKFSINLVPRVENTLADALSKLASSNVADLKRTVMMDVMNKRSIESDETRVMVITTQANWVKLAHSSVCHQQSNGQAKAANKKILVALKKKLEDCKGKWEDLMPEVLWCKRTAVKEATSESPFKLSFGSEAVIPAEMVLPTMRIQHYDEERNDQLLRHQLDLMPEIRLKGEISSAAYKNRMSRAYNKK